MTKLFNYDPYYDDFDEDKNFMRVLFRPGYAVQARELTQLQTILANQVEKFGNHIFKNGSPIVGGKISLDRKANYVILQSQYNNTDINASDFLDKIIQSHGSSKFVRAKVIAVDSTPAGNPILIVKYLSGEVFSESDELRVYGESYYAQVETADAVGGSFVASIQEGVYYFKGQFVKVVPQFLVVELYYRVGYGTSTVNKKPSYKIGIQFTENILDEIDDTSLLDPAQGAFNYQAPGATRYQVATELAKRELDSQDISSFFEIIRLVDDVKTKEIDYAEYSELEKTMARRTYDESGNYTVDPFVISLEEGDTTGKFDVVLDPGKAYVGGYEFETIAPTTISVDRAREVSNVDAYTITTNYGSSVVLANVSGTLDITSFPQLDIHAVPKESISLSTGPAYNSTKIGTVYADMIHYSTSSSSANGNTHTFTVKTFGANTVPITGTIPASGSSATTIKLPAAFNSSLPVNTFANMYFRVTDSIGTGVAPIKIISSNTLTMNLESALPFVPSSNQISIESDFSAAESLTANGGLYLAFAGNIDTQSKDITTGFASITEPKNTSLIFETKFDAIKANTISNMDFYARKKYSYTTTSGKFTVTSSGTDTFAFSTGGSPLSSDVILENIICFVRSDSASNTTYKIAPNTVVSLANTQFTVTPVSSSAFEVNLMASEAIKVDLLVTTKINNAEDGSTGVTKRKQLVPITGGFDLHSLIPYEMDTTGTEGSTVLYSANTTGEVTYTSGGTIFKSVGAVNFDSAASLTDLRTPGKPVSLQVPDVYEIIGIYDSKSSSNVSSAMVNDVNGSYDITDNYDFDNGQRKTHYDHATIKLKRGYPAPTGRVFVQFRYFKNTSVFNGLFTVDSYTKGSNISYDDIGVFTNPEDKKLVSQRSSFDFRPSKQIGGTSLSGALNPEPLKELTTNFDYYLSRIDQVVVKSSKEFAVIKGQSAIAPIAPPVKNTDMLIYTLTIPAYTESVKDVRADFKNHRRYTMEDISAFEDRIRGLEYYVSLSNLEKDAASTKILDANGLERSKYGILVDNFTKTDNQATRDDVGYDNRNLISSGLLYPASLMRTSVGLKANTTLSSGAVKVVGTGTKKAYMLSYTTDTFAKQPYATKSLPIASALFAGFKGTTKLFPEFTSDVDSSVTAKVSLNSTSGIDTAFTFINKAFKYISDNTPKWADDKNSPFAQIADSKWYKTIRETDKSAATVQNLGGNLFGMVAPVNDKTYLTSGAELSQKQISTSPSQVDVGSFVTDLSIQPYMKPKRIIFSSQGLRPSTVMYSFFDDVNVDKYVVVPNKVILTASSSLVSGETVLIADTMIHLNANVALWNAGNKDVSIGYVVASETNSANVHIINETGLPLSTKYIQGVDSGAIHQISSVEELRSGMGTNNSSTTIVLDTDAPSATNYYGSDSSNTITFVHSNSNEIGVGEEHTITGYNPSTRTITFTPARTTWHTTVTPIYSIGKNKSNKLGQVGGAFYMPQATFRSGQRNFRVTESFNNTYDADAISYADKTYVSSGISLNKTNLVDTVLNVSADSKIVGTTTSTKLVGSTLVGSEILSTWREDPLAETFFVDPQVYPYGMFLDSIDLFFKAKDNDNIPVTVQIRPTVNGAPSSDYWYPESIVTKYPSEINISDAPSVSDSSTYTNFKFDFPVFLKPGLYAFVVLTNSPEYTIWEAEKGGTTTNNEYVDKQPYLGTLYKSQNTMEYVPFLNEDLMFKLNRCVFSTSSAKYVFESESQTDSINYDKLRLLETSIVPDNSVTSVTHKIATKTISGTKETSYRAISPKQTYDFSTDDLYQVGYRRKTLMDQGDLVLNVDMSTTNDAVSPIISAESLSLNLWENFIDNAEINSEDFTIVVPGSGYSNSNVVTITSSTGTGATANLHVDANGNVLSVYVSATGSGYLDDFDISYYTHPTTPATIVLNSEYDSSGGPCLARYITKPIKLADGYDAGDLRVFLGANKPGSTEVSVFYKVLSDTDATEFKDRPYQKMECINPNVAPSLDNVTYTEYEYRPSSTVNQVTYTSTNGVTYDTFKIFAIKIVLTSNDPAIVPSVKDLRIIATPAE